MALLARRTFTTFASRSLSSPPPPPSSPLVCSRFALSILSKTLHSPTPDSRKTPTRSKTTGPGYSPLNDPSPNWSNRPPKETILLDGCDYEHWLIVMEFDKESKPSNDEMISSYVNTLASVVGSEEEAKKKIYSVSTTTYTGFGALISEELSNKVKALPGVLWVLPDSYLDVPNKDYGGDLFVDGKVVRRPQFDFTDRQQNRRPRPRYDRRRETMEVDRREPMQGGNWGQERREPGPPPTGMPGQTLFNNGPREPLQPTATAGQNSYNNGPREPFQRTGISGQNSFNNEGGARFRVPNLPDNQSGAA